MVEIWLRNHDDHSHMRCPFLVLSSRGRTTGVAPDSLPRFWVTGSGCRFLGGKGNRALPYPDTETLLRNNVQRDDLPNKPTNKLLYDAIKDRGLAYLMVFRELKVLSDWGRCGQGAPALFLGPFRGVTRFSSRSALGPPHDGVRRARRLNLLHDLANLGSAGSGLSTRSPRPSSPRNDPGIALSGESFVRVPCSFDLSRVTPPVRQAPFQSGTRLRRPTCGAG